MAIRVYKPTSAGRRNASVNEHEQVTKKSPERSLLEPLNKKGGRNNQGKITVRGRGGGVKQMYRRIDFRRNDLDGVPGKVIGIEYDPNRSCHIALVEYMKPGEGGKPERVLRYHIAPNGVTDGTILLTSSTGPVEPAPGNAMPMRYIPLGVDIHCVELTKGRGAQICRSAGVSARLMNKEGDYATVTLPSGELRRVHLDCRATVGTVGNPDHQNRRLGKAGINRLLGRRPKTRGMAMSHHEHPLGGGSGRSKGNRPPCGPAGTLAKGGKTRDPNKPSGKLIIRRRKSKRYGQLT